MTPSPGTARSLDGKNTARLLDGFQARLSDDPAKRDLELTCTLCGEVTCDIEPGDTLGTLVGVAAGHASACPGEAPGRYGTPEPRPFSRALEELYDEYLASGGWQRVSWENWLASRAARHRPPRAAGDPPDTLHP